MADFASLIVLFKISFILSLGAVHILIMTHIIYVICC